MSFWSKLGNIASKVGNWITNPGGELLNTVISTVGGAIEGNKNRSSNEQMYKDQMAHQTSEREASQGYQTSERLAQQDFQNQQREAQNAYQEQMYNKYQSPEAMVRQYNDAGLNGALAVEGAGSLGSLSASSGSSGGAPSSGAPSGSSVAPPYQNVPTFSSGFQNMAQALKALGEAERMGVDTKLAKATFYDQIKKSKNEALLSDLNINFEKVRNQKTLKEIDKLTAEIDSEKANYAVIKQTLFNLQQQGIIEKYRADTFMESYMHQQNLILAQTESAKMDANLKSEEAETQKSIRALNNAYRVLANSQSISEGVKQDLMRSEEAINKALNRSANAQAYTDENNKNNDIIISDANKRMLEEQIRLLSAQAENLIRNNQFIEYQQVLDGIKAISMLLAASGAPIGGSVAKVGFIK